MEEGSTKMPEVQQLGRGGVGDKVETEVATTVKLDSPPSETLPPAKPPASSPSDPGAEISRTSVHSSSSKELTPVPSNVTSKDSTPTGTPTLSPTKPSSATVAMTAHALADGPAPRRGSLSTGTYQSSRPAPPSPVPSRRASGIALSARERSRASSAASSSSVGHPTAPASAGASASSQGHLGASTSGGSSTLRRPSGSSANGTGPGSRPQSRIRPRSSLGTSYLTAEALGIPPDEVSPRDATTPMSGSGSASGSKLSDTPVLESDEPTSANASMDASLVLPPPKADIPVTIRDYAYPTSDDRYRGIPAPISASNSRNNSGPLWHRGELPRKASTASTGSASSGTGGASEARRPSGGGGFSFGGFSFGSDDSPGGSGNGNGNGNGSGGKEGKKSWTGLNLLGWRGFLSRKSSTGGLSSNSEEPSGAEEVDIVPPDDYAFESSSSDDAGDDGDDDSRFGASGTMQEAEEPKGLYRVAYTFEAEGEHEVGVEEGEVVLVKGRGGGEGWVIAVKMRRGEPAPSGSLLPDGAIHNRESPDGPRHDSPNPKTPESKLSVEKIEGLVPEGYLEPVPLEEEGEYAWMWEHEEDAAGSASTAMTTRTETHELELSRPSELDLGEPAAAADAAGPDAAGKSPSSGVH